MILIQSQSHSASFNLAAEEYLFSQRRDDILFLYINEPCVVMGRNQDVLSEVDVDYCSANNIVVFRRISGGGTVYHDLGNLNYSFISNRIQGDSPLNANFLQPIINALSDLQIEVIVGKRKDLWLTGGYKISGTASHIGKTRELHHGTLLYDSNLETLTKCLSPKTMKQKPTHVASVTSPVENIRSVLKKQNLFAPEANYFFESFAKKLLDSYSLDTFTELSKEEISKIKPLNSVI